MFTLVNDLSAAQFVTINVDGTVNSNDTCVVISRPSRIQVRGDSGRVCAGVNGFTNTICYLNFHQF